MLVVRGLWNQDGVCTRGSFDEVMRSDILHNLSAWVDFRVQLLLQFADGLRKQESAGLGEGALEHR
jgi:hypothetical protein